MTEHVEENPKVDVKMEDLTTDCDLTHVEMKNTAKVLEDIIKGLTQCNSLVDGVMEKISPKDIQKGLGFLNMKNLTLVDYMTSMGGIMFKKLMGESIEGSELIEKLIESRVYLEKMRPIDHKLKYQIDKLVRSATGKNADVDPLGFKANLDDLSGGEVSSDEDISNPESATKSSDVYRPPKIAPQHFEENKATAAKSVAKAKKRAVSRDVIREMQEEFLDTPVEIHNLGDAYKKRLSREAKEKQRYEETYMTRLPVSKTDKHSAKNSNTITTLATEVTDFSSRSTRNVVGKANKRKTKGKAAKGKKRMKRF